MCRKILIIVELSRTVTCEPAFEGFTPQPAKPPNRSPCSNSTDTKFDNTFSRKELWILYVSKRLVKNLLSKFAWLVSCRALRNFNPGAEISIIPGGSPTRLAGWGVNPSSVFSTKRADLACLRQHQEYVSG